MVQPTTPEDWLPILTKRLDDRRPRIDRLRSYVNGHAPLPEAGKNVRASWLEFQAKARTNFGALVVDALAERLICNGVMVGQSETDDDTVRQIWLENRMDIAVSDTIRDMLTVSIGYMVVGRDSVGRPVITSEQPEFMYAATDPLQPWKARAGVKVWRDEDAQEDYAYVWAEGQRQKFSRSIYSNPDARSKKLITKAYGSWTPGEQEPYTGAPPIVVFENHDSSGEFEPHTDILDRINKGILDRLVTTAMQAFRQRAVEGGLPPTDEAGNPIDYASIFVPAPGALWELPEGIKIWESQESSQGIIAMLNAVKDDIRDLASVTRTPTPMLVPDGANQSAAGSEFSKEGLVMKAKDRIARIKPSLNEVLAIALRVLNPEFKETVSSSFADPTNVTTAEKYDAATKAKAVEVPWRTIMISILGFSAADVDNMAVEREEEQQALAAAATPVAPAAPVAPVPAVANA